MPGVIRHRVPVQATPLSFVDLEKQAARILSEARRQAAAETEAARRAAQSEIAREREEGRCAGLEEGRAAGLAEIRAQAQSRIASELEAERRDLALLQQAYQSAIVEFETLRHGLHAEAEHGLIRLAVAIARRVCNLHVERHADAAAPIAKRLIDMSRHAADVELRVNPVEYRSLADIGKQAVVHGIDQRHVHLVADDAIARGGCVLRAADSIIDASIETQLDRVAEALIGSERHPKEVVGAPTQTPPPPRVAEGTPDEAGPDETPQCEGGE